VKHLSYCVFDTPMGSCGIAWSGGADSREMSVARFQLPEATVKATEARIARFSGAHVQSAPPPSIVKIIERVRKHLRGEAQDLRDVPVDLDSVGAFERMVYRAAREIPVGETRTYGQLAKAVGRPNAARAVGNALKKNPIALIVPCHRIQAAGGRPGGFSAHGGCATKAKILALEGFQLEPPPRRLDGRKRSRLGAGNLSKNLF